MAMKKNGVGVVGVFAWVCWRAVAAVAPADYVVDVPSGQTVEMPAVTIDDARVRFVKTGPGKLVLSNGNVFGETVIVSNGCLEADWAASGLSRTHLVLSGAKNSEPGLFMPRGASFTAPVAAQGAGTVACAGYCGFKPANADLTVDLGGAGGELVKGHDGFCPEEFDLGWSTDYTLTFKNTIVLDGSRIIIKNSDEAGVKPVLFTGAVRNVTPAASGVTVRYYDGPIVFVGQEGRVDIDACNQWKFYNGWQIFSNCTIRTSEEFDVGCGGTARPAVMTLVNCDRRNTSGWDFISGAPGTGMILDGGHFYSRHRFGVGYPRAGSGWLVITNGAQVSASTFSQDNGTVHMSSGRLAITNGYDVLKNKIGGGMGSVAEKGEVDAGAGDASFNLSGGEIYLADASGDLSIGYTHKGTLNQTGGAISMNSYLRLGEYIGGDGRYHLHGGTFTHRGGTADHQSALVGGAGAGLISVAHGGVFNGLAPLGMRLAINAGSKGTVIASPDGLILASRFYAGAGTGTVVFNGGTIKPVSDTYAGNFFQGSLSVAAVTAYGGEFDTNGKGNIGHAMTLTAASTAEALAEAPMYRWTFNNRGLKDYLRGNVATVAGAVAWTDSSLRLTGGENGASQVCLGTGLLPTDGRGLSVECWFTKRGPSRWARLFECGTSTTSAKTNFFIAVSTGNEQAPTPWRFKVGDFLEKDAQTCLAVGQMYHVAAVFEPQADTTWVCTAYLSDPATGELIEKISGVSPKGWRLADVCQEDGLWLGHSSYAADHDPDGEYHDFRIHHRAMSAQDVAWSARTGAEKVFAFRKTGAHRFWLYGKNTYPCATSVEAGELKLAAEATLPPTDLIVRAGALLTLDAGTAQTVASLSGSGFVDNSSLAVTNAFDGLPGLICPGGDGTVGTLTLRGTSLTAGTLNVDVGEDGACDKLVSSVPVDLSRLSFALAETSYEANGTYTILEAPSVTGMFANGATYGRWRATVTGTSVTVSPMGFAIMVR